MLQRLRQARLEKSPSRINEGVRFLNVEMNELLVRYLLGDLSEDEEERVEREYFAQDDVWNALSAAEDDLIRAYLRGELPRRQKIQFEKRYMDSPRNRERVAFAEALMNPAAREKVLAAPAQLQEGTLWQKPAGALGARWRLAASAGLAAAVLGIGIVATILAIQNQHMKAELARLQVEHKSPPLANTSSAQAGGMDRGSEKEQVAYSSTPVISRILVPDLARGTGFNNPPQMLPMPSIPSLISLGLDLERDEYSEYDAVLQTAEGKKVSHLDRLSSQSLPNGGRAVILNISSDLFSKGEYVVKLSGKTPDGRASFVDSYVFSAVK